MDGTDGSKLDPTVLVISENSRNSFQNAINRGVSFVFFFTFRN